MGAVVGMATGEQHNVSWPLFIDWPGDAGRSLRGWQGRFQAECLPILIGRAVLGCCSERSGVYGNSEGYLVVASVV